LPQESVVRDDLADYAAETQWFDAQLGIMLAELEARGELHNTLVVVTSDNGMPFPRVKGQIYEPDLRLPMAAMWPAAVPAGRVVDDLISFVDVAPTFLEAAGVSRHPQMSGRSFLDVLKSDKSGQVDATRNRAYMGREKHDVGREDDLGYPVRCVRTRHFLYIRNFAPDRWPAGNPETGFTNIDSSPTKSRILELHANADDYYYRLAMGKRPAEELFNIDDDPECLVNLSGNADYEPVRSTLAAELIAVLKAQGDPRVLGHGDVFESYEYVGDARHSWAAYEAGTFEPQKY
jgi:arylsulfatase A-like enzyme